MKPEAGFVYRQGTLIGWIYNIQSSVLLLEFNGEGSESALDQILNR